MELLDKSRDALYGYSKDEQKAVQNGPKPWREDADWFTEVRISAIALIKMVLHARSGGDLEVMGLMQGKIENKIFVITDAFRLPVEGTETRVNAGDEANEYIIQYLSLSRENGIEDNAVGWYHSHPGYGCWLSGIDVTTQQLQQQQGPYVAVVIDPHRTDSQGRVEIGAFRTYPEGHKSSKSKATQVIPSEKAEDFGAHADKYYPLKVSVFKSSLDIALLEALWKKYWVATLTQDTIDTNRDFTTQQIMNLAKRIPLVQYEAPHPSSAGDPFHTILADTQRIYGEQKRGTIARDIRASLFAGLADL